MSHGAYVAQSATSDLGEWGSWCGAGELLPGQVPAVVRTSGHSGPPSWNTSHRPDMTFRAFQAARLYLVPLWPLCHGGSAWLGREIARVLR